jgi:multiple sugar transport system substrate-binding protein
MGGAGLTRRRLLVGGAGLGLAAALGATTAGSPFGGGGRSIAYWHLFGGGDGVRMREMLDTFAKSGTDVDVAELILPWGNPYYTKLSLAATGGRPPDVAVMHATRIAQFAPGNLLEPLPLDLLAKHGLSEDKFLPKLWKAGQWDGTQYALPLDTHPFVFYYNTDFAEKAGLLGEDKRLKPLQGPDAVLDAFAAAKKAGAPSGVAFETRGVTPWRLFLTLYTQAGGPPVVGEEGRALTLDDDKALRALEWMGQINERKLGAGDLDYQASVAFFGNKSAAFAFNGEWEVTTFQTQKLPFGMATIPTILDKPATQADAHTFVLPRADRSPERREAAIEFIAGLVKQSLTWTKGGHVPAYKPVYDSQEYRKLSPQSDYASAADNVVFDPLAWYSGSGSNMEAEAGQAFKTVLIGTSTPEQGLAAFKKAMDRLVDIPNPV